MPHRNPATNFIYALLDPRDQQVRYIGKSANPARRLRMHLADKDQCHRVHWIQSLRVLGLRPVMAILESIPADRDWEIRERYWIKFYRDQGQPLTNGTDGGDRGPDCTGKHLIKSESARRNIVAALVRRNKSPEMRAISRRNGLTRNGTKHKPETIEKMRQWQTGRKQHSDEFKHRLAERNKTQTYDSETMRSNSRRLWDNPEKSADARARLIERNKARAHH